jgi:hypothetical protein
MIHSSGVLGNLATTAQTLTQLAPARQERRVMPVDATM